MAPVEVPVLADGLFTHHEARRPLETDVTLPNISCKRCTLQVIQFMEAHGPNNPGMYTYHHCATVQITADPKKPIDAAWPKERQGISEFRIQNSEFRIQNLDLRQRTAGRPMRRPPFL